MGDTVSRSAIVLVMSRPRPHCDRGQAIATEKGHRDRGQVIVIAQDAGEASLTPTAT